MAHLRLFQAVYGLADDWWWWRSEEGFSLEQIWVLGDNCTEYEARDSINNFILATCNDRLLKGTIQTHLMHMLKNNRTYCGT